MPTPDPAHVERVRDQLKRRGAGPDRKYVGGEGFELVGDEERVDPAWEKDNAETTRGDWEASRRQRLETHRSARAGRSVGQRIDDVLRALWSSEGGMRARPIAMTRRGGDDDQVGPAPVSARGDEVEHHRTLIEHHVRALEAVVEAELGLLVTDPVGDRPGAAANFGNARMMTTEERDRIVFDEFQGVHAEQVAIECPYLGTSARTIQRARTAEAKRRKLKVKPSTGAILGPADDEPQHLRHGLRRVA